MGMLGDPRDLDAAPRLERTTGCDRLCALGGLIIGLIFGLYKSVRASGTLATLSALSNADK